MSAPISDATKPLVVVALGGNAISVPGAEGTIEDQFQQSRSTAVGLADAIERDYQLIITHGNGPQVGSILRRVEIASSELYPIPLEVCVADTQAGMGYMIGQCLTNELQQRGHARRTSTIVTTVVVSADDPAFQHPTKPIGPRLSQADAEAHVKRDGWQVCEVEPAQFRRVVPSPRPLKIVELPTIAALVEQGELVICCGGGGIPVLCRDGLYQGAAAVVDKDLTSALLAHQLGARTLAMLTSVDQASKHYGTPAEVAVGCITASEAVRLCAEHHFPPGSMLPKMEAAIEFVQTSGQPDAVAIITSPSKFLAALDGAAGTRVVPDRT